MSFNLLHVHRLSNLWHLVNVSAKVQQRRCEHDQTSIRLEVYCVDFVKADERDKETDIGVRQVVTRKKSLIFKDIVGAVKGGAKVIYGAVVRPLCLGKTTPVDTMDHQRGQPGRHFMQFRFSDFVVFRVQIQFRILGKFVEGRVEHVGDIGRLVVHNGIELGVPENRNGVLSTRVLGEFVNFSNATGIEVWVGFVAGVTRRKRTTFSNSIRERNAFGISKNPATMLIVRILRIGQTPDRVEKGDGNHVFQTFQSPDDEYSVGSGASVRAVKMVATRFRSKLCVRLGANKVAPDGFFQFIWIRLEGIATAASHRVATEMAVLERTSVANLETLFHGSDIHVLFLFFSQVAQVVGCLHDVLIRKDVVGFATGNRRVGHIGLGKVGIGGCHVVTTPHSSVSAQDGFCFLSSLLQFTFLLTLHEIPSIHAVG